MGEIRQVVEKGGETLKRFGTIAIVLGILAMLAPGFTGMMLIYILGFLVLAVGIMRLIRANQDEEKGIRKFANSVLTIICGIVLIAHPLLTSGLMTVLLALYFISDGIFEIIAGVRQRAAEGAGWLLIGGVVSIILGIMMWGQFPISGAWAMGFFLGIKMFFVGLLMYRGGSALKLVGMA